MVAGSTAGTDPFAVYEKPDHETLAFSNSIRIENSLTGSVDMRCDLVRGSVEFVGENVGHG